MGFESSFIDVFSNIESQGDQELQLSILCTEVSAPFAELHF